MEVRLSVAENNIAESDARIQKLIDQGADADYLDRFASACAELADLPPTSLRSIVVDFGRIS